MTDESETQSTNVVQLFEKAELPDNGQMVVNMNTVKTDALIRMRDIEQEQQMGSMSVDVALHRVSFWRQWMDLIEKDPDAAMDEVWQMQVAIQNAMEWEDLYDED